MSKGAKSQIAVIRKESQICESVLQDTQKSSTPHFEYLTNIRSIRDVVSQQVTENVIQHWPLRSTIVIRNNITNVTNRNIRNAITNTGIKTPYTSS